MLDFVASDVSTSPQIPQTDLKDLEPEEQVSVTEEVPLVEEVVVPIVEQQEAVIVAEASVEEPAKESEAVEAISPVLAEVKAVEVLAEVKEPEQSTPVVLQAPLADKYQNKSGVLGERSEAISDVRKAISITDRFLYLKELFANNMEAFNDALDEINKAESMHEATSFLAQFNWEDNETSQQFMRLVSRRFI